MSNRYYIPALRGRFGDWAYYSTLMTLEQVAQRIDFARDIHTSSSLSELIQRELLEGRANEIAQYIQQNEDRFFNSLVVAIYGGSPGWHQLDVSAKSEDISREDLDDTALFSIGYLSLTNEEKIFALDGQHRLAGIQVALDAGADFRDNELPVIFVAHHNNPEGLRRTRKLFTTLNKQAKPVKKSEIIALDESDAMAISTRFLVENHEFFNAGQIDTLRKQANLAPGNISHFTTIINLYDVLSIILPHVKDRLSKEKASELRVYRPSDETISEYNDFSGKYFEDLAGLFDELGTYFSSEDKSAVLREMRTEDGGHVLFRPIGLKIFSRVLMELRRSLSYEEGMRELAKLPVNLNEAPYADTIWNTHRRTLDTRREAICRDVLLYMLGRGKKRSELKARYARALEVPEEDIELPEMVID